MILYFKFVGPVVCESYLTQITDFLIGLIYFATLLEHKTILRRQQLNV